MYTETPANGALDSAPEVGGQKRKEGNPDGREDGLNPRIGQPTKHGKAPFESRRCESVPPSHERITPKGLRRGGLNPAT